MNDTANTPPTPPPTTTGTGPAGATDTTDTRTKPYKFVVRLPVELKDRIGDAAKYYRRSMNSEIVARLEQSFGIRSHSGADEEAAPTTEEVTAFLSRTLSAEEEQLIRAYRRLSAEKQAALSELLT